MSSIGLEIDSGSVAASEEITPYVLTPEQIDAWAILDSAAKEQEALVSSGRYARYRGLSGQTFFREFLKDPYFENLYQEAQEVVNNYEDDWIFARKFRGALLERMAKVGLGSRGVIVVSGVSVFNICKALNPEAKEMNSDFGLKGLEGVYVPDGLHVARNDGVPVVKEVLEFSCANGKENDSFQFGGFISLRRRMGIMAADSLFVHVSPKFKRPVVYPYEGDSSYGKPIILPFSSGEFSNEFEPRVYWNFRRPGERTLAEIRKEKYRRENGPVTLVDPRIA